MDIASEFIRASYLLPDPSVPPPEILDDSLRDSIFCYPRKDVFHDQENDGREAFKGVLRSLTYLAGYHEKQMAVRTLDLTSTSLTAADKLCDSRRCSRPWHRNLILPVSMRNLVSRTSSLSRTKRTSKASSKPLLCYATSVHLINNRAVSSGSSWSRRLCRGFQLFSRFSRTIWLCVSIKTLNYRGNLRNPNERLTKTNTVQVASTRNLKWMIQGWHYWQVPFPSPHQTKGERARRSRMLSKPPSLL